LLQSQIRKSWPWFLLVLGLMTNGLPAAPLTLYVAPAGNDSWSGQLATAAANRQDGPLASVAGAVRAARLVRQSPVKASDGITILLRSGVYELAEPLMLTPEDSGTSATQMFAIAAYPGEKPMISGGASHRWLDKS